METLWFWAVTFLLAMYVVLDGFDFGAGILHLFIAKTENERRTVLNAIGPYWDGNEVWLLAAGGTLYFAFPPVYAAAFSGFYLPLTIVLWLLMLRGLGIELRHHIDDPLWKSFWDAAFGVSSLVLSIVLGAALGNVVRGVPLDASRAFFLPLWTTFDVRGEIGVLDWFTVLMGLVSAAAVTMHGALYLNLRTEGTIQQRSKQIAGTLSAVVGLLVIASVVAALSVRPELLVRYSEHPAGTVLPIAAVAGLLLVPIFLRQQKELPSFLASSVFMAGMLAATAFGLYPTLLISTIAPEHSMSVLTSAGPATGLAAGTYWWSAGTLLVGVYLVVIMRTFRGKVSVEKEGY